MYQGVEITPLSKLPTIALQTQRKSDKLVDYALTTHDAMVEQTLTNIFSFGTSMDFYRITQGRNRYRSNLGRNV